ncbi:hypothetical protein GGR58DRAFT_492417 [Xylaria digitata]|nr:hypothetical protein GGR58DRAFT_492417 [Xylaria digitata]
MDKAHGASTHYGYLHLVLLLLLWSPRMTQKYLYYILQLAELVISLGLSYPFSCL